MARAVKRLGRGLDSLVSDFRPGEAGGVASAGTEDAHRVLGYVRAKRGDEADGRVAAELGGSLSDGTEARMVPTDELQPNPYQPRNITNNENVVSLARSIAASGLLQPVMVRLKDGCYQIIAGERRWRAVRSLGMERIPVLVRPAGDRQMLELALIENIQREDLNAMDRARAYGELSTRFGLKPDELAERVGEDRSTVANYLRLLDLPESIQTLVASDVLSMGHARCLAGVEDEGRRQRLAEAVVENGLSVRALEEIVRRERKKGPSKPASQGGTESLAQAHVRDTERRFEEVLKTKVTIRAGRRKGRGRVIIEYYTLDDFERIRALLGVSEEERGG